MKTEKNKKVIVSSLDGSEKMNLKGKYIPKTLIVGEKLMGKSGKQQITLEISPENISVWSKNKLVHNKKEVYMYIFNRVNKDIWCGELTLENEKVSGRTIKENDKDYFEALSSMKSYMGDLFLLKPNELQILEAMDELNHRNKLSVNNFLRLLYKVLRND